MSARKKIQIAPSQLIREFRARFLPGIMFAGGLAAAVSLWNATVEGPMMIEGGQVGSAPMAVQESDSSTNLIVRSMHGKMRRASADVDCDRRPLDVRTNSGFMRQDCAIEIGN